MLKINTQRASEADYKTHFELLERWGVLVRPSIAAGTPLIVQDEDLLGELSFCLFTAWLYLGIHNQSKAKVRATVIPAAADGSSSALVISRLDTHLAPPEGLGAGIIDTAYFNCPNQAASDADLPASTRLLCPVVNRLRYNLGHAGVRTEELEPPPRTLYCCESGGTMLWDYIHDVVLAEPERYGTAVGGVVFPVRVPFSYLERYLGGIIGVDTSGVGKLFDETLLWYAMAAGGAQMGFAHAEFSQPFMSNEMDFLLYYTAGKRRGPKEEPPEGWDAYVADQALCVFETTVGHLSDGAKKGRARSSKAALGVDDAVAAAVSRRANDGMARGANDHPKNKIVNYLALRGLSWSLLRFHYLLAVRPRKSTLAEATERALESISDFDYWALSDLYPELEGQILADQTAPVSPAAVREWHAEFVSVVRASAEQFSACSP